ncbi:MAG: hypothetical protein DIU56_014565 [Pseudomonadota bacterium]|jgi:hypothetical protein|nr:MAG: hypothetical protein DIU56_05185 [Pseudomonadota bacterium]
MSSSNANRLKAALAARYPGVAIKAVYCIVDGYHGGAMSYWVHMRASRAVLIASGLAHESWFPEGRKRRSSGLTEFGDEWQLQYIKDGQWRLTFDWGEWPVGETQFREAHPMIVEDAGPD